MAKRRSRKDMYARLISYINDCVTQSRLAIAEVANEEYLPLEYKKEYRSKLRRIEKNLDELTGRAVRWKRALRNVDLEYVIQLNALYDVMKSEFEFFEITPEVVKELEKEISRVSKIKKMNPTGNVYEKTIKDYTESIADMSDELKAMRILKNSRCRKYSLFDVRSFNVQMKELYKQDTGITSNEVFNSYKLDSLTRKRSFSYIKTLISLAMGYRSEDADDDFTDLYLMAYTTPDAMVSFKLDFTTLEIYSEIRIYDKTCEEGYKEARIPVAMQTDMYKIFENFNFSIRQRKDAALKYARIEEILEKFDE